MNRLDERLDAGASGERVRAVGAGFERKAHHHVGGREVGAGEPWGPREFGLDEGINYQEKDFVAEVRSLTKNRGVDVILDSVGGTNLQKSLAALAYRGRCVTFGNAGREEPLTIDTSNLGTQNQSLIGYFLGPELFVGPRAYQMIENLLADVAVGDLRVEIDRTFTLEEAGEAHAYIESRQAFGRVVLVP